MALTVKMLKGLGLTDEQREAILEEHANTLAEIKAERDRYKETADKLPVVQKELDGYKNKGDDGYKKRYEDEHKAFEDYKSNVTAKETAAAKEKAYAELAKKAGVSDKRLQAVLRIAKAEGKLDGIELDDKGGIKDSGEVEKAMKADYADFIVKESVKGANTANPPAGNGGSGTVTADAFAKMGYTARLKLKKESPEQYAELTKSDIKGE